MNLTYIEPTVKFVASLPDVHNDKIINEDSQVIEITDSNLFNNNRYTGTDRLEQGFRFNYGIIGTGSFTTYEYPEYQFLLGQSYRFKKRQKLFKCWLTEQIFF